MTVTRRGCGYALNGDVNELLEALNLLEHYIEHGAQWARNASRYPAMMAKAKSYKKLRERLTKMQSEIIETRQFELEGKPYEAIATKGDNGIYIRVFHEGKPVSPSYSVTYEVGAELAEVTGMNAVNELMEMAVRDLAENFKGRKLD